MKVIILLAILCSAFADHHEGHDPCLHQCRDAIKTKMGADTSSFSHLTRENMGSTEGRRRIRNYIKSYVGGTAPAAADNPESLRLWNLRLWMRVCTIGTEAETCVNACPESPKREGFKKSLALFKLGCDADFKSSINCLMDVDNMPSETCQTKCAPLAAKLNEYIAQRDANPTERVQAPKDVLESGCKFVNCRLNCRKADMVNKCQDIGFEQAKKLTSAVAQTLKMFYKRTGGDLINWPDTCKSDTIIEAKVN